MVGAFVLHDDLFTRSLQPNPRRIAVGSSKVGPARRPLPHRPLFAMLLFEFTIEEQQVTIMADEGR